MKILLASDHAGFYLKGEIMKFLAGRSVDVEDLGPHSLDPNDDYPDFIAPLAERVSKDPENTRGIILGGSGEGEAIVANRFKGVRAGVFYGSILPKAPIDAAGKESVDPFAIIHLMREHDDANVLSLAARFLNVEEALRAVSLFIDTSFQGEERHLRRIKKIDHIIDTLHG